MVMANETVLATRLRARAMPRYSQASPSKCLPKRREAERRKAHCLWSRISGCGSAPHGQMLPPASASGARASRRSTAALATQINAMAQPKPCFLGRANAGRYPPSAVPVQRGTPQAGRNAGRTDARTARVRGYKPRPREPHPPRQSAVTGDDPSRARLVICNGNRDSCQGTVTVEGT